MAARARRLPPNFGADEILHLYQIFLNNVTALSRYTPGPYDGPICWFRARQQPTGQQQGEAVSWQTLTTSKIEAVPVPGDHFSMIREPHVAALARALEARLEAD